MTQQDLDQVMSIEQMSFSMPWSRNLFLSEFRNPSVSLLLVALADNPVRTVIGYIVCWVVADELHILNLAMAGGHRRKGIGKNLVFAAIAGSSVRGARHAFLEVRASNASAQALYVSLGFVQTGVRQDYYDGPDEDAVVMILDEVAFDRLKKSFSL
jgi:ribosomal-protein-alanine N-acetyltransferase